MDIERFVTPSDKHRAPESGKKQSTYVSDMVTSMLLG
jgi:hypothetical protein